MIIAFQGSFESDLGEVKISMQRSIDDILGHGFKSNTNVVGVLILKRRGVYNT